MAKRNKKSRKKKESEDGLGRLIGLVAVIAVIIIAIFSYTNKNPIIPINQLSFCPIDPGFTSNRTTFLIDTTETLAPSQTRTIQNRIRTVIDGLNEFDKVDFFVIESSEVSGIRKYEIDVGSDEGVTLQEFCIPQENNWELTPLQTQLNDQLQRIVTEMFIEYVSTDEPQPYSPILDALRFIAADNDNRITNHSIYVVSDMIEHTPTLSMYATNWYESAYTPNRNLFLNSRPQFQNNTSIYIWALMRPIYNNQEADWVNFWSDMIRGLERTQNFTMERITGDI